VRPSDAYQGSSWYVRSNLRNFLIDTLSTIFLSTFRAREYRKAYTIDLYFGEYLRII